MRFKLLSVLAGLLPLFAVASTLAAGNDLPGDRGRPREGIPDTVPATWPPDFVMPRATARALAIDVAVQAAKAIAAGCKQFPLGIAIVNAAGAPILVYLPDGSDPHHGYTAIRKAYTAITFNSPTVQLISKAQQDVAFAAKIKSDTNLMAYSGGVLLRIGNEVIGAVGVSGAEPGAHDEECALRGLKNIKLR